MKKSFRSNEIIKNKINIMFLSLLSIIVIVLLSILIMMGLGSCDSRNTKLEIQYLNIEPDTLYLDYNMNTYSTAKVYVTDKDMNPVEGIIVYFQSSSPEICNISYSSVTDSLGIAINKIHDIKYTGKSYIYAWIYKNDEMVDSLRVIEE
jgi:hypothetical protein